ncbi:CASP-like protein 1C1 [Syzygium oleosum]|uniref:CASP-like protein 1C1 n=1 Tax=Syzygium oleosum TaxID=219896 RepID=UPI0011D2327A|nr:CASP-like protein 1C1 [Syzygium oleosum]
MAKVRRLFGLVLRLLAFGATASAAIVMGTSRQRASVFSISFEAKYSDIPSFKYFLIANAIVSVYSFLVIFLPAETLLWRLVAAFDLAVTMLLTSSISAALAVAQVGKDGNAHAGWLPICGQVPTYCDHVTGALGAGFAGLILYVMILLYSLHTVLYPLLV